MSHDHLRDAYQLGQQVGESEGLTQAALIIQEVLGDIDASAEQFRLAMEVLHRIGDRARAVRTLAGFVPPTS